MNDYQVINGIEIVEIDGEPRIQDIILGDKLGFSRPRDIRKLINRMIENNSLDGRAICRTPLETSGYEYYLTEKESLLVIRHCDTQTADQVMEQVFDVFIAYRNGKLTKGKADILDVLQNSIIEISTLRALNESKDKTIGLLAPAAEFANKVLDSDYLLPTTTIAKQLGVNAAKLNRFLHENKVIFKQNGTWYPYAKHESKGLHKIVTTPFTHSDGSIGTSEALKWTQSGRKFIFELWEDKTGIRVAYQPKLELVG